MSNFIIAWVHYKNFRHQGVGVRGISGITIKTHIELQRLCPLSNNAVARSGDVVPLVLEQVIAPRGVTIFVESDSCASTSCRWITGQLFNPRSGKYITSYTIKHIGTTESLIREFLTDVATEMIANCSHLQQLAAFDPTAKWRDSPIKPFC